MSIKRFLFPASMLISLLVHGAFFLHLDNAPVFATAVSPPESAPQVTRIVFNHRPTPASVPTPMTVPAPATPAPKAPAKKEVQKSAPKRAEVKPKLVEKTTPIVKKVEVSSEPAPPAIKQQEADMITERKMAAPSPVLAEARASDKKVTSPDLTPNPEREDEKQRYLKLLLAHIESHKYYPRPARKRGIEGHVNVSFSLSPSGELSAVNVAGGPALLRRAARQAVQSALPLPNPPASLSEPLPVQYRMAFMLQ
ncbi:MAG TPA: energy transducer TonB [Candidatus Tenderia sp.]|nr:energy transducer TonB [Candidatus Tenderia sp.]